MDSEKHNKLPNGLIVNDNQITITLGDGIDLLKIMNYLRDQGIVSIKDEKDYMRIYIEKSKARDFNIKMCGKDKDDIFSINLNAVHLKQDGESNPNGEAIFYNKAKQHLEFRSATDEYIATHNNYIETYNLSDVYTLPHFCVRKDTNGNLSLFKDCEDGNVYILNKVNTGQDAIMQAISTQKFKEIEQENFTKISHTYGSNIRDWWKYSIDDYSNIDDNDKPSPIKRFGRTLIGQNGMTGQCLWWFWPWTGYLQPYH